MVDAKGEGDVAMSVIESVRNRVSVRAFLDKPIPREVLEEIFAAAQLSPSNCNVQPWQTYVVFGEKKDQLKDILVESVKSGEGPNPEFNWRARYFGVHRERQFDTAKALYGSMGIEREDRVARFNAMLRNWDFFDAPYVAFFTMEKYLDIMGAVDLGIYAQTLTLLMTERGISSCMQGALGQYPEPVHRFLNIPEEWGILFGMSFGYADQDAPVNTTRTTREVLDTSVKFIQ